MLGRLVVKLLFKACVPLVAVAGVMTYGVYLKGGDPAGLWKNVASGALGTAGDMVSKAKTDVTTVAGNLSGDKQSAGRNTDVFTWKDDDGVTHFGTSRPEGTQATKLSVNPDVNIVVPVIADRSLPDADGVRDQQAALPARNQASRNSKAGAQTARQTQLDQSVRQLESDLGQPLPGIGGQLLSGGAANGNAMDPAQLIRLLQSANQ